MHRSQQPLISFEFFPPKTAEGVAALIQSAKCLSHYQPDFFSVTFGAGGSTRDGTLNAVNALIDTQIPIAPHLSCAGLSHHEIEVALENYRALNIKRLVVLRGDLPSGMGQSGDIRYANELVSFIRKQTGDFFHIEVAGYPETHPESLNATADITYLKQKVDAGANSIITQYFFNPDAYFYFVDAIIKQGITVPVIPGIMPITQFIRLVRFSDACGAEIPRWLRKRLEACGDDINAIQAIGHETVLRLCETLLQGGAPGLHFYTLNHAEPAINLLNDLTHMQQRNPRTVKTNSHV